MCKAHLLIPEGEENVMYSWLLNFQYITEQYYNMYSQSRVIENEPDIFIFSDPSWSHPDHPMGLAFFDPKSNCAALLGMRYFGEHKKGTLTLAWGIANRHGYASCHGGQKRYNLKRRPQICRRRIRSLWQRQIDHHARTPQRQVRHHGAA